MWERKKFLSLTAVLLFLLPPLPALAREVAGTLGKSERWQGEIVIKQNVQVPPGSLLMIAPGTTVRAAAVDARLIVQGILKVQGTAARPVLFAGPTGWQGIEFVEAPAGSIFEHVRFDGAAAAVSSLATSFDLRFSTFRNCQTAVKLLRESNPRIEDCLFAGNNIGIESEMKSIPAIRRNRFTGHQTTAILASHGSTGPIEENLFEKNKQGIGLLQKYTGGIARNKFIGNGTGIFCNQTQNTPQLRENLFEKNENALINFSFAYPAVENNRFLGNGTAIRNDQFGSPRVARNLFRENGTALYNNRKSNPTVEKNRLEANGLAIFCDYSSYPRVKENNFLGNKMGVKLGIYQSADWEKRSGSKGIVQKTAAARNTQNPLLAQAPTEFQDQVDVSGNWWGKETETLARAGKEANLPQFHDRHDQPEVSYEGFGPGKYRLDRIVYSPWLAKEVADAGPQGGK